MIFAFNLQLMINIHGKIYGIYDNNNDLRYIGQTTKSLKDRLAVHVSPGMLKKHSYLSRWLKGMKERNETPIIEELAIAYSQEELDRLEIVFIKIYRELGYRLVNMSNGGAGRHGY